jgi:hypothetical protein
LPNRLKDKPQDMTKDEIYEHLAKVYLGKREKHQKPKKKEKFRLSLAWNLFLTIVILSSAFYGFTAFLSKKDPSSKSQVIFTLNNSLIRLKYDLTDPYPKVKQFSIAIPAMDVAQYKKVNFSIRGTQDGSPGIVKVILRNKKNEVDYYFARDIDLKWKTFSVSLNEFEKISDWTELQDISFVLEGWNLENEKGVVLIDGVNFSS